MISPFAIPTMTNPATPLRRMLTHAGFEAQVVLRHGEQLIVAVLLPLLSLVILTRLSIPDLGSVRRIDVIAPGVLALAVVSISFTGQAIQTGFDRRYGALRLWGTTPLGKSGLIAGKGLAVIGVSAVHLTVISVVALFLDWRPLGRGIVVAIPVVILGVVAFVALGLFLAGTLRAEAVLAIANVIWVFLVAGGGLVLPLEQLPAGFDDFLPWLPSAAFGDAMRAALQEARWDVPAIAILGGWAAGGGALVARTFRWQ
ncbi:MAG: ABC transporter permease [Actinomycetota bacterium]